MAQQQERYLIGPGLRDKLRDVITRVDGIPSGSGGDGSTPVRLQGINQPFGLRLQRGTFTGSWNIGESKAVSIVGSTAATVSVTNYCVKVTQSTDQTASLNVIFGNVMGTTTVVEIQPHEDTATCSMMIGTFDLTAITGYSPGSIQLLGHRSNVNPDDTNTTVCVALQWFSITQCSTVTP